MKIKYLSFIALLLVPCFVFADAPNAENPPKDLATEKIETKQSPKDALLTFVLDKAKSYSGTIEQNISKAVDFAKEEAPIVVKEFLVWRAWENGIKGFTFPVLIIFVAIPALVFGLKSNYEFAFVGIILAAIIGMFALMTAPIWLGHIMNFVQIQVAPRIYIIEQAIQMVKK